MLEERILGVDPGLANTGFGIVDLKTNSYSLVSYGCITTKPDESFALRLQKIYEELNIIIKKFNPKYLAVEELFFCKNVKSALAVGQAKGVIILTGAMNILPVYEYTPLQIKQSVVSYGRGSKEQVQQMVKILLSLKDIPKPDHAADALAAAICCGNDATRNYEI